MVKCTPDGRVSGKRRKAVSGRSQAVWVLPEYGPPPADDGQYHLPGLAA